jgi:hypothetical protein
MPPLFHAPRRWFEAVRADPIQTLVALALCVCVGLHAANALRGWDHTLLDSHRFRQCQTALSASQFLTDGFKLAYETPVFGPPWSIPMEAPVYQGIVAGLARLLHTPLEQTGRAVSLLFFYGSLWPLFSILRSLGVNRLGGWFALMFVLSSPLYVFWSRAFLVESTALCFSLLHASLACRMIDGDRRAWVAVAAVLTGTLGALTKITSFAVCVGFTILFFGWRCWSSRGRVLPRSGTAAILFLLVWLVPVGAGVGWGTYADYVKRKNPTPMAQVILSANLKVFNFGTLHQRISGAYWRALEDHGVTNVTFSYAPWIVALTALVLVSRRRVPAVLLFAAFCSGPAVFANLYAVHDYYWYANSVFLLAALAVPLGEATTIPGSSRIGATVLALLLGASQWWGYYHSPYIAFQIKNQTYLRELGVAIRERTSATDVMMAIGFDWDSSLPYYAGRRAIMPWVRGFESNPGTIRAVQALVRENRKLALLVVPGPSPGDPEFLRVVTTLYGFEPAPSFDDGHTMMFVARADQRAPELPTVLGLPCLTEQLSLPVVELEENGHKVWRLHAPSRVTLALPPQTSGFSVWYGLARLASTIEEQRNGASFKITLVGPAGRPRVLLDQTLEPKTRAADKGLRAAEFTFAPMTEAQIVLETGTNGDGAWDWTVWSAVIPRLANR